MEEAADPLEVRYGPAVLWALSYGVAALGLSIGVAYAEGRLFVAEKNVYPYMRNLSTIIDFGLLNPLVVFFLILSKSQKRVAYSRMGIARSMSYFNRFGLGAVAVSISIALMGVYVSGFKHGSYFDATVVLQGDVVIITYTGWVVFTLTALFMAFVVYMAFEEVNYVFFILALEPKDIPYTPVHADESGGVRFLADPSLTAIYAAMAMLATFLVFLLQDFFLTKNSSSNRLYLVSIYAPAVVCLVGPPLIHLHRIMTKRKEGYVRGVADFIGKTLDRHFEKSIDDVSGANEYLSLIECAEKYKKLCSDLPQWPMPVKNAIAPAISVAASLAPMLQKVVMATWAVGS